MEKLKKNCIFEICLKGVEGCGGKGKMLSGREIE